MKKQETIDLPEGYKMTELGPLPEEWEVVRLGEEIEEMKEKNKINAKYPVFTVSNIYGLTLSDNFFDKRVYSKKLDTYKIIHTNFFVYNPYRINVGSIGLFNGEIGLVSPAYVVFKIKNFDRLNPKFLYNLIKSPFYLSEIKRISFSRGSVRRSLSFKDLSNFKIPLLPLPEQKKIAAVLSSVQEAKEKTEAVIKATKELKKSLMKHLFTYGPMPVEEAEKVKLKETEIGEMPEEWEVVKLGDVADRLLGGGTPSTQKKEYWGGDIEWTTSKRINNNEGIYLWNGEKKITSIGLENSSTHLIPKDNLIIGTRVGVGKVAINKVDIAISQDLTGVFIDKNKYNLEFLAYRISNNDLQHIFIGCTRGTTIKGIPRDDLKKIPIPLPPLETQQKIASILSAMDEKIQAEENKKKALEDLFKTLLHDLMTAKIRVKHLEDII